MPKKKKCSDNVWGYAIWLETDELTLPEPDFEALVRAYYPGTSEMLPRQRVMKLVDVTEDFKPALAAHQRGAKLAELVAQRDILQKQIDALST